MKRLAKVSILLGSMVAGFAAPSAEQTNVYVMLSGWALYPEIDTPGLEGALSDIAKSHVSGIVYGTLGVTPRISAKAKLSSDFDPNAYNRALFKSARAKNANLWLQLRYYDNWVAKANLTAPQILSDPNLGEAFLQSAMDAVAVYADAYPDTCTVILGEEETMYHSKLGGGHFWAGAELWDKSAKKQGGEYLEHSAALDRVFVDEFAGINRLLIRAIQDRYPRCRVGAHIGHEPLYENIGKTPIYGVVLKELEPLKFDFTFYDLYEKVSKTDATFENKLAERVRLLKSLGQPVYYLAQLHTTNSFGAGAGRTPSAPEIDQTLTLAEQLGVDGFGYYTKNTVPTLKSAAPEDSDPLDPNVTGQNMAWESSPRRWKYGLSKLAAFIAAH